MDKIVECVCGHPIVVHDSFTGCMGERLRPCHCSRDRYEATDDAVRLAGTPHPAAAPPHGRAVARR